MVQNSLSFNHFIVEFYVFRDHLKWQKLPFVSLKKETINNGITYVLQTQMHFVFVKYSLVYITVPLFSSIALQ